MNKNKVILANFYKAGMVFILLFAFSSCPGSYIDEVASLNDRPSFEGISVEGVYNPADTDIPGTNIHKAINLNPDAYRWMYFTRTTPNVEHGIMVAIGSFGDLFDLPPYGLEIPVTSISP
ncbi:MAG: hypothetical protein LBH42_01310 [Treponema sp.]|nr:hypothetical protein [Treponema sp.]